MSLLNSAAMALSSQKKMARDVVGRKQSMPPRAVVGPRLINFPHTNAAVSALIMYYKYKDIR